MPNFASLHWTSDFVNLDQVRKFEYLNEGNERVGKVRVWWVNGDVEDMPVTGRIETENYFVVPASPGFELLTYFRDDDAIERVPVIAWRIEEYQTKERYSDANPIAIGLTDTSLGDDSAVRCPDGKVTIQKYSRVFENTEAWEKWVKTGRKQEELALAMEAAE